MDATVTLGQMQELMEREQIGVLALLSGYRVYCTKTGLSGTDKTLPMAFERLQERRAKELREDTP